MNTSSSTALSDYYALEREALASESTIRGELRALGIVTVEAQYDGVGDSGQIDEIKYLDDSNPAQSISVGDETHQRVETLLYALLSLRHGGWENDDGGYGSFSWNLEEELLEHVHHQRFTDCDTSVHHGFEFNTGAFT